MHTYVLKKVLALLGKMSTSISQPAFTELCSMLTMAGSHLGGEEEEEASPRVGGKGGTGTREPLGLQATPQRP